MNVILIPTYNRSAKLKRVLDWYARERLQSRIVILDASNETAHSEANRATVSEFPGFVTRLETAGEDSIPRRLLNYLETIDDELVAIGNDEDVFLPEFLEQAFNRLRANPDYVLATGRYITSARPLVGLRRVSYWTDCFVGFDIDEDDPALRVINFQRMNSGGVPPLYWSVRRRRAFNESCRLALGLKMNSAHELMDQITSCVLGKISIAAEPMLLRDESKVGRTKSQNRDAGRLYIAEPDLSEIEKISSEHWGQDIALAVQAVTSWYRPKISGESYQSRQNSRSYCRFHALPEALDVRSLAWLQSAIRWSCTLGILLSQFAAFLYFARYMFKLGRGSMFLQVTKAVSVNKVR